MAKLGYFILWLCSHQFFLTHAKPQVQISEGLLSGYYLETYHNRTISGFAGIPFAEPPINDLRFRSPIPKKPWKGFFKAEKDGPMCPQFGKNALPIGSNLEIDGNEDCLFLNVFTPKLLDESGFCVAERLLPVMFWIHGGGFKGGSSDTQMFNPRFLLDKDVILVTTNYRLGILGFLSTGDSASPGNYALKDLALALKWVQKNIRAFGGNPKLVTIFGQSAGGAAIEFLTLSNATNGLFKRYITESGSSLATRFFRKQPKYASHSQIVGKHYNCNMNNSLELMSCLRGLSVSQLLNTTSLFSYFENLFNCEWGPTSEPKGPEAILTDSPRNIMKQKYYQHKNIQWMTGVNRDDGLIMTAAYYASEEKYNQLMKQFDELLSFSLLYDMTSQKAASVVKDIKQFYFNNTFNDKNTVLKQLTVCLTDLFYAYPMKKSIEIKTSNQIYLYKFHYRGTFSLSSLLIGNNTDLGVCHTDELQYLFYQLPLAFGAKSATMSKNDLQIAQDMVELWTSFASTGIPSKPLGKNSPVWLPYHLGKYNLRIGEQSDPTLISQNTFYPERMAFWNSHYPEINN